MFLAVDIGNTNVTCGIYDKGNWVDIIRIPSDPIFLNKFKYLDKYPVSDSSISSVVPELTNAYVKSIKNLFQINPFIINYSNAGIRLDVDYPQEVGIDRICNTAAAKNLIGTPVIVGDIGSATNYDVIDEGGSFIGGSIAPGIEIAARNLFEKAALLKETAFTMPKLVIGKDTATNLQSGIMFGAIDFIDGMFKRIQIEAGWNDVNNIITGGFGKLISPHLKTNHILLPELTLDGIRIIYGKQ